QKVELLFWRALNQQTAVANCDIAILVAAAQEREKTLSNIEYLRINFKKGDTMGGPTIRRDRAGSESDNASMLAAPSVQHCHDVTKRAALQVVPQRFARSCVIETFHTVYRVAMLKPDHVLASVHQNSLHTKKVSGHRNGRPGFEFPR